MNQSTNELPDDYHVALRRFRVRKLALASAFFLGLPLGAAGGFIASRILMGDYGGSSVGVFIASGAVIGASALFAVARALISPA